jgi:hypothetical protein
LSGAELRAARSDDLQMQIADPINMAVKRVAPADGPDA